MSLSIRRKQGFDIPGVSTEQLGSIGELAEKNGLFVVRLPPRAAAVPQLVGLLERLLRLKLLPIVIETQSPHVLAALPLLKQMRDSAAVILSAGTASAWPELLLAAQALEAGGARAIVRPPRTDPGVPG